MSEDILNRYAEIYKNDGYPPLAGKVIGLFYISDQKYFSFEEVMNAVGASKGATSKTINLLLKLRRINYISSEEQKRKRLFYLDIEGLIVFLNGIIDNYDSQNDLLKESLQMRTDDNQEMNDFIKESIQFNKEILAHLRIKSNQYFNLNDK